MKYKISESSKPKYLQLYEQLRNDIISGIYPHKSKLPSKRLLSEELQISIITVEHTYSLLCDEGYAESIEKKGYFVIYNDSESFGTGSQADFSDTDYSPIDDIDFPFSVLAKIMRRVLTEYGKKILMKVPNKGLVELRMEIAKYLARNKGINATPEQIVIGAGAEYLYGIILQLFGSRKIFAIENPSYEKIAQVYKSNNAKCELLNLGKDGIISDELIKSKASVLHITPYRSYPSGVTASASKRKEYVRWAQKNDRYIVEDDFESEFSLSSKPKETVYSMSDNVIYLNTFSKTIAPSIRIGYMVLPQKLLSLYDEKVGFYSCTVPSFEQYVLAEFIGNGDFERHLNRVRRKLRNIENEK